MHKLVGLILSNNQIVILHVETLEIFFEHRFNDNAIMGLYFDINNDFFFIVYIDGEAEVFSANFGNLRVLYEEWPRVVHSLGDESNPATQRRLNLEKKQMIGDCFNYERSLNAVNHYFNLLEFIGDYKNCYVDFNSFNQFCKTQIQQVSLRGDVLEFNLRFLTNCLTSVHVDYPKLNKIAYDSITSFRAKDVYEPREESTPIEIQKPKDMSDYSNMAEFFKAQE